MIRREPKFSPSVIGLIPPALNSAKAQRALDPSFNCASLAQARSGKMIKVSPDIFVIGKGESLVTSLVQNKLYLDLQEVSY